MGACCPKDGNNNNKQLLDNNNQNQSTNNNSNKSELIERKESNVPKIDVESIYRFGRTLGKGASCTVVSAHHKDDLTNLVAIKIMNKDLKITKKLYFREINVLKRLCPDLNNVHPNILHFIAHGENEHSYYIVTKLLNGGELFDRIISKDEKYKVSEKIAVSLMKKMFLALKYCHDRNIVHRDLKPENFVFASKKVDSEIVLIDYGCARIMDDSDIIEDVVGTVYYLAPELAAPALANYKKKGQRIHERIPLPQPRTGKILKASDIWSMGVIAYVMMTGRAPFRGANNVAIFQAICLKDLSFPDKDARYHNNLNLSEHFKDFCIRVLDKDPNKRLTIDECIRHPWINGLGASEYRLNNDVIQYLRQFKYQARLKKEITRVLATNMTSEPSEQVKRHFERLDADKDGFLDLKELTFMLMDMGYAEHEANAEAVKMIHHADLNKDGFVDFDEFKQVWYRKVLSTNDAYIHRVFSVFDDNNDGQIDSAELGQILFPLEFEEHFGSDLNKAKAVNEQITNDDNNNDDNKDKEKKEEEEEEEAAVITKEVTFLKTVRKMIKEVDDNHDGKINFQEFKNAMIEDIESGRWPVTQMTNVGTFYGSKAGLDDLNKNE